VEIDLREEPSDGVWQALEKLSIVRNRRTEDGRLLLELEQEENIPDIVRAIASVGGSIYSVSPQQYSLEQIYFRIEQGGQKGVGA